MPKAASTKETPMARLAAARAAKAQVKKPGDTGSAPQPSDSEKRPERKAMTNAKEKAVWNDTKPKARKRAASSVPQPGKIKQPRKQLEQDETQCVQVEERTSRTQPLQNHETDARKAISKSKRKPLKVASKLPADADEGDDNVDASDSNRSHAEGSDQDELPSDNDDLEELEAKPLKLKAMLQKEMPRFSGTKLKYADNLNSDNISSATPSRSHSRSSSSAAVSEQSFATDPPSEDNMSSSDLEKPIATRYRKRSPEIDQDSKPKSSKSGVSAPGKRELARNLEKPKWRAEVASESKAPLSDATLSDVDSESDQASVNPTGHHLGKRDKAELQWPESCRLRYNDDGKVNLNTQTPHIQSMLRETISELHKHILFENAHPSYQDKPKITADLLLFATQKNSACTDVRKRLKKDSKYVRALAAVPEGRVSTFRGAFLTAAMKHVMPSYGLRSGPELKKAVAALLENDTYIYPVDEKGQPILSKPLQHDAIVEVIKEVCFENDTCPGVKFHSQFASTLEDRPDERELPPPIIALAATAVHAALLHLTQPPTPTGAKAAKPDINSYFYAGIYAAHTEILTELFRQSERKYHVMMFQYYRDTYGYRFEQKSMANSNIRRINWAAMPEE